MSTGSFPVFDNVFDNNKHIISTIANNDPEVTTLMIARPDDGGMSPISYFVQADSDHELELLGQLVGESTQLREIELSYNYGLMDEEDLSPFYAGLINNKSIFRITLYWCEDGQVIRLLQSFFKNNHNLTEVNIQWCILGREGSIFLASAIKECIGSLSYFKIKSNVTDRGEGHSDEELSLIIQSLSSHRQLKHLIINGENIGTRTLGVLESLLRYTTELHTLNLNDNAVNEVVSNQMSAVLAGAMNHLNGNLMHLDVGGSINGGSVPVLMRWLPCSILVSLNLSWIDFGETEVEALARALKADPCLEFLRLRSCGLSNADVVAIAEALSDNAHLKEVNLSFNDAITSGCWTALSNTLCDTSTVNKTNLSNHTLSLIIDRDWRGRLVVGSVPLPPDVVSLLELNRCVDKRCVAKKKILKYHRHFDIQPFVQWDFKVLPLLTHWLDKAFPFSIEFEMNGTVEMRKLTVIYEFIQALPELFVLSHTLQELVFLRQKHMELALKIAEREQRLARL